MQIVLDSKALGISFIAVITSFIFALLLAPRLIPALRRFKFGQEVRDDGPQSHLKKQGTPTMGGIIFLVSSIAALILGSVTLGHIDTEVLMIMFLTVSFGAIGFADDWLKIKKKNTDGLKPKQKMAFQFLITIVFSCWVYYAGAAGSKIYIPFTGIGENGLSISLPIWLYIPFMLFVVLGTDNGVNFTDGLDGLCSSVTAAVAALFILIGLTFSHTGTALTAGAMLGGLLGYLIFNVFPAKIFMGDTGSLALGGFVAASAAVCGMQLYIPVFGFIYMIEVISVIIQVAYFKKTKGKRFFKMAPIHHHFELLGNSETRVTAAFTIVTILLCGASFIGAALTG